MKRPVVFGGLAVAAALVFLGGSAWSGIDLAEKEEVDCNVCHVKQGSKKLTDKGKYYEQLRTFEGYDKLLEKFGKCTYCHVSEAGSKKLTKEGKKTREVVKNMKGLFEWLKEGHTGTPGE
jgi:hypothetical protein